MDKSTLRKQLLVNITQMCQYAEQELINVANSFEHTFEHGFRYGHKCDKISFFYNASTHKAHIGIHHYATSYKICDNKIFHSSTYEDNKDITNSYLTDMCWCDAREIQDALTITQQHWRIIKTCIQQHKDTEASIMNFQL